MKRIIYCALFFILTTSVDVHAQLAVVDTIHFRPSYLEDSSLYILRRNDHFIDAQGNFWIGFSNLGARRYADTLWTQFDTTNSGIASNYVLDVSQAANNNLWFGTNAGASVYDGTNWTTYNRANSAIVSDTVTVIEHFGNTNWIGTRNGLSKFDGNTFTNYTASNSGLPTDSIISLATDPLGNVWVGTMKGLAYFDGAQWTVYDTTNHKIGSNTIYDIKITATGDVWVAGGMEGVYYLKNGVFVNYNYSILTYYLTSDINGSIYFQNNNLLFKANPNDSSLCYSIYSEYNLGMKKILYHNSKLYFLYETINKNYAPPSFDVSLIYDLNTSLINCIYLGSVSHPYSYGIYNYPDASIPCDLNVNSVRARILNKGDMHWNPIAQVPYYEVPLGSNKNSVYASSIWLGGLDQSGLLHTAAQTYRQSGANDFYTGPLDTITSQKDSLTEVSYNKLWKADQWIINEFRLNFLQGNVTNGSYIVPDVILQWPAQGSGNYSRTLAPFVDYNHDGNYNAMDGDYPLIDGDQMVWWIFNDQGIHTETNGTPFGFELHGKAYGYACPDLTGIDTLFNYATFYQWKIINRSTETYHDMYVGLWCDFDMGNAADDFIGCDVGNASFFAYNADPDDDGAGGYGTKPPMQNITVLKGPLANANDGIDNNHNAVVDEQGETVDLSNFMSYIGLNNSAMSNPNYAADYYSYLKSVWLDGKHLKFGGDGYTGVFDSCNYKFPGTTDPAFPAQDWTMATALFPGDDVRGVGGSGPFTIAPGETRTIDFAYLFTRDANQQISLATNQLYTSYIRNWFKNGAKHPCPHDSFTFIPPVIDTSNAVIYPNPAIDYLLINIPQGKTTQQLMVYDMEGRLCISKIRDANKLDIKALAGGLYILKIVTNEQNYFERFVKVER